MELPLTLSAIILKHLEPLVKARRKHEGALIEAGYTLGLLEMSDKEEVFFWTYPAETHETIRILGDEYALSLIKKRFVDAGRPELDQSIFARLAKLTSPYSKLEIEQYRQARWTISFAGLKLRQAGEVARFSTILSRAETDEEVYDKVLSNYRQSNVTYRYEDTLPKRLEIIKTILESGLATQGFELDKALSTTKQLVYCKEFRGKFRLFIATDRSALNPKKGMHMQWGLGFYFGLHSLKEKWPGEDNVCHVQRWPLLLSSFVAGFSSSRYPFNGYGFYQTFKSLPELELSVRFHLFAYQLIADDYEAALRAAFAEAEAAGVIDYAE